MPEDMIPAQPANAAAADPASGPAIPFSAPTNSSWEAQAIEKTRELNDMRTYEVLNGRRATVWRICVEKKRRELASIFGVSPGGLAVLPPDCRGKILEFLPAVPSGGAVRAEDARRMQAKKEEEIAEKWAEIVVTEVADAGQQFGWSATNLRKSLINPDRVGDTLKICDNLEGKWWKFPALKTKVEALGYTYIPMTGDEIAKDPNTDNPYVVSVGMY